MALLLEYVADFSAEQPAEIMEWVTCDQAFFFFFFFSEQKSEKSAERKRKIRLIYLFAESSATPQLMNLSTATSRHLGFHASVKAATGFKRHSAFAGKTKIHSE